MKTNGCCDRKLSGQDLLQLKERGMSEQEIFRQIECLQEESHFVETVQPASDRDGIYPMTEEEIERYTTNYDMLVSGRRIVKFVPASGAATRMFKKWFQLLEKGSAEELEKEAEQLTAYPFYSLLEKEMGQKGLCLQQLLQAGDYKTVFGFILNKEGLNYGQMPKGLLPFHVYSNEVRSSFEEHWVEGTEYAQSGGKVCLHFTVSPEHKEAFEKLTEELRRKYEGKVRYEVEFSEQMPQTDTVSLTENGDLVRDEKGSLLFRPGGHGSLIYNLNGLDADVVFIKNIDNVTIDDCKADTYTYKKSLLGLLLSVQKICFKYLDKLESGEWKREDEKELELMIPALLGKKLPEDYSSYSDTKRREYLYRLLDRPIRVCGMVARENEPGGGPFWIRTGEGVSLQIVETAEMDLKRPDQFENLDRSQYFNPVDLVCSLKNHKGKKFNLPDYVDPNRYFLSEKSYRGENIRVLEHPGLWNGAMSNWNTMFVRVPSSVFTPVKEVRDLLRPAHLNR